MFRILCKISQAIHLLLNFLNWMPLISVSNSAETQSGCSFPIGVHPTTGRALPTVARDPHERPSDRCYHTSDTAHRPPVAFLKPICSCCCICVPFSCYHLPFCFPVSWLSPYWAQHYHFDGISLKGGNTVPLFNESLNRSTKNCL